MCRVLLEKHFCILSLRKSKPHNHDFNVHFAYINNRWDYVLIKDKDDKIIGSKMCGMKYSFPIKVPGDKAVVIFHSDDYGNENGFKVNFKTIAAPPKALPGKYSKQDFFFNQKIKI